MTYYPREVSNETGAQAKRRTIITAMRQGREYTSGDIERMTGIVSGSASHQLGKLIDMGLVEQTGCKDSTRFYGLVPKKPYESGTSQIPGAIVELFQIKTRDIK